MFNIPDNKLGFYLTQKKIEYTFVKNKKIKKRNLVFNKKKNTLIYVVPNRGIYYIKTKEVYKNV